MKYPIAIEPGDETHAWGVVVPDLPGCFSAADSGIDEAIDNAKEAIAAWIEAVMDDGGDIPAPTSIAAHRANPEFDGWIWAVAEVDPAILDDKAERVNTPCRAACWPGSMRAPVRRVKPARATSPSSPSRPGRTPEL